MAERGGGGLRASYTRKEEDLRRLVERRTDRRKVPFTKARPFILGYTGFIPGMIFRYGKTYGAAADESLQNYSVARALRESRRELEGAIRKRPRGPPLLAVAPQQHVNQAIMDHIDANAYHDEHISADFPPIAGYTGHIPRIKYSDASISQRYAVAAKNGLLLLHKEREKMKLVDNVREKLREAHDY